MEEHEYVSIKTAMSETGFSRAQIDLRMAKNAIRYLQDPVTARRRPHLGDLKAIAPRHSGKVLHPETEGND